MALKTNLLYLRVCCNVMQTFLQEYVSIKKSSTNFIFYIWWWPCHFHLRIIKETLVKNLNISWKHLSNTLSIQTEKDFYLIVLRIVVRDQEPLANLRPQHSWIGSCYYSTNVMISVESEATCIPLLYENYFSSRFKHAHPPGFLKKSIEGKHRSM